ncbi:hypothetical protein ACFLSQ_05800 [Bacteroidota bacterium]
MLKKTVKYFFNDSSDVEGGVHSCIDQLNYYLSDNKFTVNNILQSTAFIRSDKLNYEKISKLIESSLKEHQINIPNIVVAQAPYKNEIAFEVLFIDDKFDVLKSSNNCKIIKVDGVIELYTSVSSDNQTNNIKACSTSAHNKLKVILSDNIFSINDIVRQWNYIADILNNDDIQHYQEFNNQRTGFYKTVKWDYGYPAATGIGTRAGGIGINLIAAKSSANYEVYPIKNPKQTDAHSYSEKVLRGSKEGLSKTTPKFERGKIIITNNYIDIYVSGTAAIIGENTIPEMDVKSQTRTTIENILSLVSIENLRNSIPEKYHSRLKYLFNEISFSYIRAYVKQEENIPEVEKICHKYLGDTPTIFVVADICRGNLLVEIETAILTY